MKTYIKVGHAVVLPESAGHTVAATLLLNIDLVDKKITHSNSLSVT